MLKAFAAEGVDVTGASVFGGTVVTGASAAEDTDVVEASVATGKDVAGASVAEDERFMEIKNDSLAVIVHSILTTINFIGTISTFGISIAIDNTHCIIIFAGFRSFWTSNA